jgi:two-component system, LytTR family, response regulator
MIYKAIVIDDEKRARTLLKGMLDELSLGVQVVELCEDLPEGVRAIKSHKPHLVFLDIEMPGHSGLELLDFFDPKEINFSIIFTTAYNQYAVQAFKLSAIDYLLKPIAVNELEESVQRFKQKKLELPAFGLLKENLSQPLVSKIAINTVNAIKFIETNALLFMKADGAYTQIYLVDDTVITSSKSLKYYEDVLEHFPNFMRCHKSYLINLNFVSDYIKSNGGYLILHSKYEVALSSEKSEELLKRLSW